MNTESHADDRDDEQLVAQRLEQLKQDTVPAPSDVVDLATHLGGDVFLASSAVSSADENADTAQLQKQHVQKPGGKRMIARAIAALSIVACTIAIVVNMARPASGDKVTFGTVLDKTLESKSLRLSVSRKGTTANVVVRTPGHVRWETSTTTYSIAKGTQLWRIDEKSNAVSAESNPWFNSKQKQIDLLAMIGFETKMARRFRETQDSGTVTRDGRKCRVFRMVSEDRLWIEAIADFETGDLRTIAAWPNSKRQGPPLAELRLLARDVKVDESQFVVAKSLSKDGRIGKVVDLQGIVGLRPMTRQRWTPIARQMLIKPGDWLRTDVRGANAGTLVMTSQFQVIAGPGSLVELTGPRQVRLHRGEVKISSSKAAQGTLELTGPSKRSIAIVAGEAAHYRVDRAGAFQAVKTNPVWLAGYEGSSNNESIGSLIARVDGRDVPLAVGFHKVKVEIRDQIARTTIEESFVNRTNRTLEGIFHFPLPQDASISGFGMWINGELIEADVVEKQRAREIYETILSEKRDPGLLEWTGGNIFKARVFPIPAHSEKRIRIVYTQVLPLRGNRFRYSYALRSELLQTTPVRELSLDVRVHSALPLKAVTCPTHSVRTQLGDHSARLEFSAQEYTPERDFEVVCEVNAGQSDVVMIPHRRGDDGYFLIQLRPPGPEGNWQREILPDGKPLELLIVCDTSASMDLNKRRQQEQFLASLLAALSPQDRFNVAVCDVNCRWLHKQSVAADKDAPGKARDWLAKRTSLGWTDLDRMTQSVLKRSNPQSHVIYVGDGIVTARDADAQTFVNRLRAATGGKRSGTFHAVSVGSSFESVVLKAMARVGGGSLRQISGEQTPQAVALELLNEVAQPGLRDLKIDFRGLQVAAVYPDKLPNLAAGMQQIIIGRYLPQGKDQKGEIRISGTQNGKAVRFASRVSLADAEAGNSFIPRLWARGHLDHLLQQGSSSAIRDDIIALSEEFHIITPYTSLLVLESDKDRERFGVKRRFRMRDGERFFTEGRNNASYELLQQQMKRAGDWRLGLRRRVLAELLGLGRNSALFQQHARHAMWGGYAGSPMSGPALHPVSGGIGGGGFAGGQVSYDLGGLALDESRVAGEWDRDRDALQEYQSQKQSNSDRNELAIPLQKMEFDSGQMFTGQSLSQPALFDRELGSRGLVSGRLRRLSQFNMPMSASSRRQDDRYVRWIDTLFPSLAGIPEKPPARTTWSGDALIISKSLVQPVVLKSGGLEILRQTQTDDPRWKRTTGISQQLDLFSMKRWLTTTRSAAAATQVSWCDGSRRGIYSRAFHLGRVRKAKSRDLTSFDPGHRPFAARGLHISSPDHEVVVKREGQQATLTLTHKKSKSTQQIVEVDTQKKVVLRIVHRQSDKVTSSSSYSDHVQVSGVWWPGTIESFDAKNRRTSRTTQQVKIVAEVAFQKRYAAESADKQQAILLPMPLPTDRQASIAVTNGSADIEHRLVLLKRAARIQKWNEALKQLAEFEKLRASRPGLPWIRAEALIAARKNDDARVILERQAKSLATKKAGDEYWLAGFVLGRSQKIVDRNEMLRLLDKLRSVFNRQPEHVQALRSWSSHRANQLRGLGRTRQLLALQLDLAKAAPWDVAAQVRYANDLATAGHHPAAYAWLRQELDRQAERSSYEKGQLRRGYTELLRSQGRANEYAEFLKTWRSGSADQALHVEYLSALQLADRDEEADALALKWLRENRSEKKLSAVALAQLNAAISYAMGQRYRQYMNRMAPKWNKPLAETARFFLPHDHHFDVARRIVAYHSFTSTDESYQLRGEIARRLKASVATLHPERVTNYVIWSVGRKELKKQDWAQLVKVISGRWDTEKEPAQREKLARAIIQIYKGFEDDTELLSFIRKEVSRAEAEKDPAVDTRRLALFDELLSRKWNVQREAEALRLIPALASRDDSTNGLIRRIGYVHRFVDRMLQARYQVDAKALQDSGHPEKLTRQELAAKRASFQTAARRGLAAQLDEFVKQHSRPDGPSDELLLWVGLESMYLKTKSGQNLDKVAAECWKMLGEVPKAYTPDGGYVDQAGELEQRREALVRARLERVYTTVKYLATRRSAAKPLVNRLVAYVAAGTQLPGEAASPWKNKLFKLRIALDQPDTLIAEVRGWIRVDPFPAPWQLALGRLLAERGRIDQAIQLFQTVKRTDLLGPADFQVLADWFLVADRRDEHERAKVEVFKATREYQISSWLRNRRRRWTRNDVPLPTELDRNVLFAFKALFEKSNQPQNYVRELKEFYAACRDHRLLQMVPDALIGRTAQQIYPFLKALDTNLMIEIRDEASADAIMERVSTLRQTRLAAIDRRALDLLESMVERRSAKVLNQPGPHVAAAVQALKRAFERPWADGEVRQMSSFLDRMGVIERPRLSTERLRQLRALHSLTTAGTIDRLYVGWYLSHSLFWSHRRRDEGMATMENAVREFEQANGQGWPSQANTLMGNYVSLLEAAKRFAVAEKILSKHLAESLSRSQKQWFIRRRFTTYTQALRSDGQVSLGAGNELYKKLQAGIIAELQETKDDAHRRAAISLLMLVYDATKLRGMDQYKEDFRDFAFKILPAVLKRQTNNYQVVINEIVNKIKNHLGAADALRFAIDRYEDYPDRFEYTYQNAWQQLSSRMASWHVSLGRNIGDLEPRLLAIVLDRLRNDLATRNRRTRYFYDRQYYERYFWEAKAKDFARVAEEVLRERDKSGRAATFIAGYMYNGLGLQNRAIEVMMIAHGKGLLDTSQQIQLCKYLHGQGRHGESIPILEPIVKAEPNAMSYRTLLLTAYHRSKRPQQMQRLLAETDAHFRQGGRWTASNISLLAHNCLDNRLFRKSVDLFDELIPIYQRSAPNRGIGNYQLPSYYTGQARAYSGLGKTKQAVTAASAAVIAWGGKRNRRDAPLYWLGRVLSESKDLDGFVKEWDAEVMKENRDSPIIRKRLGLVYAERKQHQKAIAQYRAAIALQPTDVETHQRLIQSLDAAKDTAGAIRQTLALLDFQRHDLKLYTKLAERLSKNEAESERAVTTIVEAAPSEAEHHGALAAIRQKQDRWSDAIEHWKHVARLRSLEPDGLLKLAAAQIHEKRYSAAQESLDKLTRTVWPARFRNIGPKVQQLQKQVPAAK